MPFITEEIWQRVAPLVGVNVEKGRTTLMLQPYPAPDASQIDTVAIADTNWLMAFILGVRRIRGEMNLPPGKPLPVLLQDGSGQDRERVRDYLVYLEKLARLKTLAWLGSDDNAPESAIAMVGDLRILIPMAGLIDKQAELNRLDKEIQRLKNDLPRIETKLNNPGFIDKAPADVIGKEKARLAELVNLLKNLEQQHEKITLLGDD